MFPPQIARVFIEWLTEPGESVYDPFCGRGTVPLEALLAGRVGLGSDANPLATRLAGAKVKIPSESAVLTRLDELEKAFLRKRKISSTAPSEIRMLYTRRVLGQLEFLREGLSKKSSIDRFITALVLGVLHANHSADGATRGVSISMPNTFAMSPNYVRDYIKERGLRAPEVDVFEMLRARLGRYELATKPVVGGRVWQQNATRSCPAWMLEDKPKLIFTSPPYLQTILYGKYNWIRLWFLGHASKDVDARLMASGSLRRYLDFMTDVLENLRPCVARGGYLCLVIGDVRRGEKQINLAREVLTHAAAPAGWHSEGIISDNLPDNHKVSRIWKHNRGRATKVDRVLILTPTKRRRLPPLSRLDWSTRPKLEDLTEEFRNGVINC